MFIGILLIIVGLILLLQNLGLITAALFATFWPIFVLAIGIKMIVKHGHHGWKCEKCSGKEGGQCGMCKGCCGHSHGN